MPWLRRSELSWNERYRRCLYFFLRDSLDSILVDESLIKSYKQFQLDGTDYPFVEMRELKPRAKVYGPEYSEQRHFIVILNEETLPPESKKHIRFLDSNKLTKENLATMALFDLQEIFRQKMRYFEDSDFATLLRQLLDVDFAVLIQRDPSVKARYRYALTHFHVQIDWPVADASFDLGRYLRYFSRDLYEKGEKVAEILQQKLYEYYGFHYTVGGRRTAALVAARFMKRFEHISTVYVSSSESRTLFRISEQGIYKYVLIQLSNAEIKDLSEQTGMKEKAFAKSYLIDRNRDFGVGIFLVSYLHNEHSKPPPDGKLREFNPDYQWLNVDLQLLVPPPGNGDVRPVPWSRVYS
jgi:hypothetical protein